MRIYVCTGRQSPSETGAQQFGQVRSLRSLGRANIGAPITLIVEAVGKPQIKIPRISVLKLALQNRVHTTICLVGMVNVPPYLPHSVFRGLFLHPR